MRFGTVQREDAGAKLRRKVHCSPFYTEKDSMDTPVIGAWGVKNGVLTIRVYEIEFLEEDTLTLTEAGRWHSCKLYQYNYSIKSA